MKKIISFLLIPLCLFFCACNDDDDNGGKTSGFTIESQDLFFGAKASEGSIVVKSDNPITATSSHPDWCTPSVSGNTVTVTTAMNPDVVSRDAKIKITSGGESIILCVHQEGIIVSIDKTTVNLEWTGNYAETNIGYTSTNTVTVDCPASWLVCQVVDNETIHLKATDNPGNTRTTTIKVTSGGVSKDVVVNQDAGGVYYADIIGTWNFTYNDYDNVPVAGQVTFTEKVAGSSFTVGPILTIGATKYNVVFNYDAGKKTLTVFGGQNVGTYSSYTFLTGVVNFTVNSVAYGTAVNYWAKIETSASAYSFRFLPANTSWANQVEGLAFYAVMTSSGAGAGIWEAFRNMTFTKAIP